MTFEAEFKALLCGVLTLVTAVVIFRDLVVGVPGLSGVGLGSGRWALRLQRPQIRNGRPPDQLRYHDHPEDRAHDLLRGRDLAFYRTYRRRPRPHPKASDPLAR